MHGHYRRRSTCPVMQERGEVDREQLEGLRDDRLQHVHCFRAPGDLNGHSPKSGLFGGDGAGIGIVCATGR